MKIGESTRVRRRIVMNEDNRPTGHLSDTQEGHEWARDHEEEYSADEDDGGQQREANTELLDELELGQLSVLRRMAQKGAQPTHLRERVRNLEASPHRQSKLKNLRKNIMKSDNIDLGIAGGSRMWVEVDQAGCLTGLHRPDWLTRLRGYFRDLNWSVDNFKEHPRPLLLAVKDKMAAQFEYRGGLGDVPEGVIFQELRTQMRTKRSNMKKMLEQGLPLPGYIKKQHVENFKRLIARTDKIAEAYRMKACRKSVQNVSHSGRSEWEVRSRLAADLDRPPTQLEVETELHTPRKSNRNQSSSSRGGERGIAAVGSELHSFQDSVKGELEDMKAMFKELLQEVRKQKAGTTSPASSEVGTTGLEEPPMYEEGPPEEEAPVGDLHKVKTIQKSSAAVVSAPTVEAAHASPEEPRKAGSRGEVIVRRYRSKSVARCCPGRTSSRQRRGGARPRSSWRTNPRDLSGEHQQKKRMPRRTCLSVQ